METPFRKDRMEILKNFLLTAPIEDRFDLASWAGNEDIPWGGLPDLSCGTSACAIGFATTIPEFAKDGLCLTFDEGMDEAGLQYKNPVSDDIYGGFDAVQQFFGIEYSVAEWLFQKYRYHGNPKPRDVAARIQQVIDNEGSGPL